jgi:hypothetical protein
MWLLVILITMQTNPEKRDIESQYHMFERELECRDVAKKIRTFRGRKYMKHIYSQCFFVKNKKEI